MLHSLTVHSCVRLLSVLQSQLEKTVEVKDIVKSIPDDVEEQEKILQVLTFQPTHVQVMCTHVQCMYMICINVYAYICTYMYVSNKMCAMTSFISSM